ncbi:MAG: DegT/DnrJ/EryC1/StrS family aminotransferase [Desulfobacteraceae bacterium]|nr:DegT/DnrJ/EryC1/StrS family aminotransferase [Desulfobacteraceae bacterium]
MLTVNSGNLLDEVDRQIGELSLPACTKAELTLECERRVYSVMGGSKFENYLRYIYSRLRDAGFVKGSFKLQNKFHLYRGYVRFAGEMMAKAGLKQLKNWPELKQLRRQNTEMIEEHFSKVGLALWPKPTEADVTMLRYPVLTPHKSRIVEQASKKKLDLGGWYMSPIHPLQRGDLAKVDYRSGSCQKAEDMISQLVHLPTGLGLNKQKLGAMASIISHDR